MRIASLIPSGTDIVIALGLGDKLVGISHACDAPSARHLPVLTRSIIDSSQSPAQIDDAVNQAVSSGQSLYITRRDLLRDLKPDLVLTQSICDVCAVNAREAGLALPAGATMVQLQATSFAGLWEDLRAVAAAAGINADELIAALRARLEAARFGVGTAPQPAVLMLEWTEPYFLGGHWVPEMVELAGGRNVLSRPGEASRRATRQEISATAPQVVILAPCGYDLEATLAQGRELIQRPEIQQMPAAANQIWATNATALFSRCTPASVRGVEVLAGILHPELFPAPEKTEALPFRL